MSVLSRTRSLLGTPTVPAPRTAAHDGGVPVRPALPEDRRSGRRRAALVLVALVAAIAAVVAIAVVQLTGDDTADLAPTSRLSGTAELDTVREEVRLRHSLTADAERGADAQLGAVQSAP
jgi:hypothetical protein